MRTGLQAWHDNTELPGDPETPNHQAHIGWDMLLDGWLSLEWRAQQAAYWAQWKHQKSSKWWMVELIKKLWNISWDLWDHRNEALHKETSTQETILDSRTNGTIRWLLRGRPQVVLHDALPLFKGTLAELLQHPKPYKDQWIASVKAALWRKQHHEYSAYLSEQCGMRRWLGLETTPPSG